MQSGTVPKPRRFLERTVKCHNFMHLTLWNEHYNRVASALLNIQKVPSSNLGPEISYPDSSFRDFPQILQKNARFYLKLDYNIFLRQLCDLLLTRLINHSFKTLQSELLTESTINCKLANSFVFTNDDSFSQILVSEHSVA
jgi:hypothetical protein